MKDPKQGGFEADRAWMQRLRISRHREGCTDIKGVVREMKATTDAAWRDSRAQSPYDGWYRALTNWDGRLRQPLRGSEALARLHLAAHTTLQELPEKAVEICCLHNLGPLRQERFARQIRSEPNARAPYHALEIGEATRCLGFPSRSKRMGRDSNPRAPYDASSFQDCRLRPLGHPSRNAARFWPRDKATLTCARQWSKGATTPRHLVPLVSSWRFLAANETNYPTSYSDVSR